VGLGIVYIIKIEGNDVDYWCVKSVDNEIRHTKEGDCSVYDGYVVSDKCNSTELFFIFLYIFCLQVYSESTPTLYNITITLFYYAKFP
jgi:hypothetical protein